MDTPPICDYEGSDYQTSFWEEGGRAYEDAVENTALERLLPSTGKLMLELGAGAGRNTKRYENFEQIVLVDYSRTQLQQARKYLGQSNRFRYVAADIYQLPFVTGLFDAATMIRTLHHMAEPRLALTQVREVLQSKATFILEFANKKNLKSILRYILRRQTWNPFSPEPIEFAALNYDFHPATLRSWLNLSGFVIERQLTVSHLRIGLLKRTIPLNLLVWLDSLFSLTGNLWQLTPSVFIRSRAIGASESAVEGTFFRCPACKHTPLPDTPPVLHCPECGNSYPVEDGIYNFKLS
jgi:2-polyprenyl-3-methyl-5-hydroxy-6-metoxy-1,4-benzoquinol methylase